MIHALRRRRENRSCQETTQEETAGNLGLCPDSDISGRKVLSAGTRRINNRAALALPMAANALHQSKSWLGDFYGRVRSKMGAPKAITAAARKLARITFHLLTSRQPYDETVFAVYETQSRTRVESKLRAQAKALGFQLVRPPVPCAQESVLSHGNDGPPTACPCIHQNQEGKSPLRGSSSPFAMTCPPSRPGTVFMLILRLENDGHKSPARRKYGIMKRIIRQAGAIERTPARIRHVRQSIG